MKENIGFAKWCHDTKLYIYDSRVEVWFHYKKFNILTWEEIYEIYINQLKK